MTTQVKVNFARGCTSLMRSRVAGCDRIGELSLVCDSVCNEVNVHVDNGVMLDMPGHNDVNSDNVTSWMNSVKLTRKQRNDKLQGSWFIKSKDKDKINIIVQETLVRSSEQTDAKHPADVLSVHSVNIEVEVPQEMYPFMPQPSSSWMIPEGITETKRNPSSVDLSSSLPIVSNHDIDDTIEHDLYVGTLSAPSPPLHLMEPTFKEFEDMNIPDMSPRTLSRFTSKIERPKLERSRNMRCNRDGNDINMYDANIAYSSLHEEAMIASQMS